jgi:hypothetical protein
MFLEGIMKMKNNTAQKLFKDDKKNITSLKKPIYDFEITLTKEENERKDIQFYRGDWFVALNKKHSCHFFGNSYSHGPYDPGTGASGPGAPNTSSAMTREMFARICLVGH